jgi:SAM-dependent methyltransferase
MHAMNAPAESPAAFWNERYRAVDALWSSEPNVFLAELATPLPPGRALDLGAGEGRNAVWLARRGWHVTALDVSSVALGRAAARAAEEEVQVDCVEADWRDYRPAPASLELVVISFMHPEPSERTSMFARAGEALAPGGHLFVVGVELTDHGRRGPPDPARLYTPQRLREALRELELLRCESVSYEAERKEGRERVVDVVAIARTPARAA